MTEKFNLSKRRQVIETKALAEFPLGHLSRVYREEDVKEFIRLLKEEIKQEADKILNEAGLTLEDWKFDIPLLNSIDKLAGEKLI